MNVTMYPAHPDAFSPIAVVGVGCRFPGGVQDATSYWSLLMGGGTGITDIPADRWNADLFYSPEPDTRGKMRTRWGGFLAGDVFGFDPAFFDMSPREVTSMDPQQRLLLQVAFEAVEDAGLRIRDLQAKRTGVFVGMSTTDYMYRQQDGSRTDIFAGTGSAFSIAANRVSHRFDLKGPSMTIDTACSSALVAVDQAVHSILAGDCDMALAGGVNCLLDPRPFVAFSTANMLSPTGAIYTFDSRANGFVRGEGCGLVLLKPLADALAAGDHIYGVIRQTAINQDGHTKTLTSPSGEAQEAMLRDLVARSRISPRDVGYVEAHGTGTPIGDPIEATAIGRVFGEEREEPVWIGSFKPNLGHLESGSGIAGFIKSLLTVHHGMVPPNRNFSTPNPSIPFDALGIRVPTAASAFATDPSMPRLAVVNSFGFGGTNASALIEEFRPPRQTSPVQQTVPTPRQETRPLVVPLSSGGKNALALWASRLASEVKDGQLAGLSVQSVADALWQRDQMAERAALVVPPEPAALATALTAVAEGRTLDQAPQGPFVLSGHSAGRPRLALAFSGQGGQWWGMSRRLLQEEPVFRRVVGMVDEALRPHMGWSLIEEMMRDEATSRINEADRTQGSIFACQIGLYEMWKARGIVPELLIGHSFGEIASTYVAGVLDLDTVARIIAARGRIPFGSERRGAMATLGLTVEQLQPLLPEDGSAVIAAFNGPVAQTIAGMEGSVDRLMKLASEQYPDAVVRRLTMNFGWHSEHLDDCEAAFRSAVGEVSWKDASFPIVSTVTGVFQTRFDLDYWWDNLRQPVSYTKAVGFCLDYGIDTFLEIGPHRTLTPLIRGIAQEKERSVTAVNSLDRKEDDYATLARAEAQLFVRGLDLAPPPAAVGASLARDRLPKMPWANQHLSNLTPTAQRFMFEVPRHPLLGTRDPGPEPRWTNELLLPNHRYISDHRVNGDTLFPAVGYLEVMGAALRDQHGAGPVEIRDFRIHDALSLATDDIVTMRTELDPRSGRIRIFTEHRGAGDGWRLRAEAYGWRHDYALEARPEVAAPDTAARSVPPAAFYGVTRRFGLEYGPQFRPVDAVWRSGDDRMRARLSRPSDALSSSYFAFPGTFDGILQACILFGVPAGQEESQDDTAAGSAQLVLPVGARRILLARPLTPSLWVDAGRSGSRFDFLAYDDQGEALLVIEGLETRALGKASKAAGAAGEVYTERFEPAPPVGAAERKHWLLLCDDDVAAARLATAFAARGASLRRASTAALVAFDAVSLTETLAEFCRAAEGLAGVLFCWDGGAQVLSDDASGDDLMAAVQSGTEALVTLARAMASLPAESRPKLAVLSRTARRLPHDAPMRMSGVAQSATLGLSRTIANELPELRVVQIDADEASLTDGGTLSACLMADSTEPELALRKGELYVARLERTQLAVLPPAMKTLSLMDGDANFRVTMSSPGIIDNIRLREAEVPEPEPNGVVVAVAAVGLNFRDVMAASGILPDELEGEEAYWNNLGLEFAGTVVKVGEGVTAYRPGDRVMGMGKGYLRRYARAQVRSLMRVPDSIDLVSAASMPVAYITAHYSLVNVGRVEQGESVLVHLASGGVGLAAIEVCRHAGAEVIATAGSDEKRNHLRKLGIRHVMNSRGLDFAREVREVTGGRGVDLVLNALSGAGIDKSLECLAPFGRLVEIGKRDLAEDKPIGLKSLYWNNSYSVVDLSTLPDEKPRLFDRILREVETLIQAGVYTPLTSMRFPVSEAAEALRTLARARHIGKVVVSLDCPSVEVERDLGHAIAFRPDGAYLVTGGLKGFGTQIGNWASLHGAGKVILANRSGRPDEAAAALIAEMEARGTKVECAALDVTDHEAVRSFVSARGRGPMQLRGIFHAAAVIEDAFLTQLDRERIRRVLAPKVAGAQALAAAVRQAGLTLDHFALFSSIAQLIGSAGQANYTAANSVLNAFADYRAGRGEAANAVAWGMIGGSGFVARSEAVGNYLDSMGIRAIADTDAAAALGSLMRAESRYAGFARVDWPAVMRAFPAVAGNPRIKPVLEQAEGGQSRIQAELMQLPRSEWDAVLGLLIRDEVARVLKADTASIAVDKKLTELGLDSLSSFELKNRIESKVEVSIPVARFLQAPTIAGLSKLVATAFESKVRAGEAAARAAASRDRQGGGSDVMFRPLTRQVEALERAGRPMTSAVAAADLVMRADVPVDMTPDELAARLKRLAGVHDALSLAATQSQDGSLSITMGEAPVLELSEGEITLPGPLWRFTAAARGEGGSTLTVMAHRAAADAASVSRVIRQLTGKEPIPETASSFAAAADWLEPVEETATRINDLAYWKEMMSRAPKLVPIAGRRRAAAPAGLGINRGEIRLVKVPISGPRPVEEAMLLSSYAAALGVLFGKDKVLIERHGRPVDAVLASLVGPLAQSHPVLLGTGVTAQKASALLAMAVRHAAVDTAVIEAVMAEDLRQSGVSLRQFGFAPAEPGSTSLVPMAANEVLLIAEPEGTEPSLTLAVDADVMPEGSAAKLLDLLGRELDRHGYRLDMSGVTVAWGRGPREEAPASVQATRHAPSVATRKDRTTLPLTINQECVLTSIGLPGRGALINVGWVVVQLFRVTPQLDVARLNVVLNQLRKRHEALRTRFVRLDGGGHQAILFANPAPVTVQVEPVDDLDTATERAHEIASTTIDPYEDELFQVHVVRVGTNTDIVVARGHHIVLDGYSMGLLVDEMMKLFLGMSLDPIEIDTEEFIRSIDLSHDPDALRRREEMLEMLYADPAPPVPHIYRPGYGESSDAVGYRCRTLLAMPGGDAFAPLRERCRAAGITLPTFMSAAYAQTIGRRGGVDEVIISTPMARRHDVRTRNLVNYVASDCFFRLPVKSRGLNENAAAIGRTLEDFNQVATIMNVNYAGEWHERIARAGSYGGRFNCSMLTGYRSTLTNMFQMGGEGGEIDLGFVRLAMLPSRQLSVMTNQLDLRLLETSTGFGLRFTYSTELFTDEGARDIFHEVMHAMGLAAVEAE